MNSHAVLLIGFSVSLLFVSALSGGDHKRFLWNTGTRVLKDECKLCKCYNECNHGNLAELRNCDVAFPHIRCSEVNRCTCCDSHPNHMPCLNGGTCQNTGGGTFTCACMPGYSGYRCGNNASTLSGHDHCSSNPCANGATCNNGPNDYICQCQTGWTGNNCDKDLTTNLCASSPCKNGGNCTNHLNNYMCMCAAGWTGTNCETDVDECANGQTCKNGATCTNTPGHYLCSCVLGWTGQNCDLDACHIKQCGSHGDCVHQDTFPFYHCNCTDGHFGSHCELRACDIKPCHNGGSCISLDKNPYFRCECPDGYSGDTCSSIITWSDWFYGACSVTCGTGTRERIRKCSTGHDEDCKGLSMERTTCSQNPCTRSLE
ncbi:fibropellin-1-like isoform X2 [Mercenaria mercenaria]|uniref:fibropellin-1-like isoform X2 n=1 Tax=Mercenaria mercenaria TaxID=6596 RepID=UPI00234F5675|nr:fibropellin-1-like isoform X2 [Mercenaria mercenaria]